ncbi:MAG: amidohydrolase [Clostridia bacterium]|nr:amidohydrolase [Clostridia bacterium]
MLFQEYLNTVDTLRDEICNLSDTLWDMAELPFREFKSAALLVSSLRRHGFTVEEGVAGIPTSFVARYGSGKPVIGILAEYDALSGISQKACVAEESPIEGKDSFHGCGHNLFAAGSYGAALAVRSYVEKTGKGSVILFGCPGEEGKGGKVFMSRAGVFKAADAIVSWHPEQMYMVRTRPALANVCVNYSFKGITAHAGAAPEKGRSALDAVELMNVAVNFLREHVPTSCRMHYAILDAGGIAPNMVQSRAVVQYLLRASTKAEVLDLRERVDRIAQGAALMTDTTFTTQVVSAYSDLITIPTLQKTADAAMNDVPLPVPSEEDLAFAKALQSTMKLTAEQKAQPLYADHVREMAPPVAHGGSTDTADVSWNCPTVQMHIGTWVTGTPGHSWQSTSQGKIAYTQNSMLYASKAVAATAMRLLENPSLVEEAKKEHLAKTGGVYVCPLPDEVQPDL